METKSPAIHRPTKQSKCSRFGKQKGARTSWSRTCSWRGRPGCCTPPSCTAPCSAAPSPRLASLLLLPPPPLPEHGPIPRRRGEGAFSLLTFLRPPCAVPCEFTIHEDAFERNRIIWAAWASHVTPGRPKSARGLETS